MPERLSTHLRAIRPTLQPVVQKPRLVCFSHLRWDFVWQRPQHLLTRAAKSYDVLVIEEPVFKPQASPHIELGQRPHGITIAVPVLPEGLSPEDIIEEQRDLVTKLIGRKGKVPRVFWYYTPMALAFTSDLECDLCVYDNMDELSLFRGASQALLTMEDELFTRADLVFTGGMSLYEAKRDRHRSVHGFPSSIDFSHFSKARNGRSDPNDQAIIRSPRVGFFGVIDERMDLDLVAAVAERLPGLSIVMIGPVAKIDPALLPQRANIHWLGGRTYDELPPYLSGWDIGFMPFALNDATRFISPTKTPEFLAAGVPVISTPIKDVVNPYGDKGLVEIARDADEVVAKIDLIFARPKAPWLARVDRHLAAGSWDKTWSAMERLISEGLGDSSISRRQDLLRAYAATAAE
ncbi:MAG: glycosyl transferase [Microvirga sp.]|jgi:glycosyltransferase involved in cell wall biosynthesis|nr:glycosyl transferase [Microvirga sp.]